MPIPELSTSFKINDFSPNKLSYFSHNQTLELLLGYFRRPLKDKDEQHQNKRAVFGLENLSWLPFFWVYKRTFDHLGALKKVSHGVKDIDEYCICHREA